MKLILSVILGYLIGSIPWALIIGKTFYHKDIRNYGSGNLGGTNAARVLGKPVGITIMVLDALKTFIYMLILNYIYYDGIVIGGIAVCLGHCFPLFANFKGGKAVACGCGFMIALNLFVTHELFKCFVIPFIIFLIVMFTIQYMSIASMSAAIMCAITGFIYYENKTYAFIVLLLALFIVYMHRSNIKKLINHQESKLNLFNKKNKD